VRGESPNLPARLVKDQDPFKPGLEPGRDTKPLAHKPVVAVRESERKKNRKAGKTKVTTCRFVVSVKPREVATEGDSGLSNESPSLAKIGLERDPDLGCAVYPPICLLEEDIQ